MLDLLFVAGEQNVVFMSNKPSRLRWQMSRVKANGRRIVAIYRQLNELMKSLGHPVEYWSEAK
jgi:hypothetical protein